MASSKVKIDITLDLSSIADKISDMIQNVGLDGIGDYGDSSYEITDVSVEQDDNGDVTATVSAQHVTGKFASKSDIAQAIVEQMDSQVELEITAEEG